ncbi:uncharacterized protein DUF4352 [Bacillus oleivorans]|uniref:Uncharacterized protein DUF4352 n=1 Tax=Bacillus oleivorans TaxID=1448271 RepID=A0A285CR17_9BACI|nr:DUF4352 domain-containing protein [Bacillus oleivorans]SNX69934.1 uncharacterized protein DUF4352 [Bacillus oleivorans]
MKLKLFPILFSLLLILGACGAATDEGNEAADNGGDTAENGGAAEENGDQEQAQEDENQDEAQAATIGDTVEVEGVKITLESVEVYEGEINQFQPLTQDHAIVANLVVENTNQEAYFIDNTEFTLYDAEGFELTQALPSEDMALSTELPGGKKVKGTVYFDVPAQEGEWELRYESMASFDGEAAVWRFPAK